MHGCRDGGKIASVHARLTAPSAERNRGPILQVLTRWLPAKGRVLEVASGTGEHISHFAGALPGLDWQPTDLDAERRASIDAWAEHLPNVSRACQLDAIEGPWPAGPFAAVLCVNMIHIAPPEATAGLIAGAAKALTPGGALILYGPFRREGCAMTPGNAAFDADLRARNPAWGLRVLEDLASSAAIAGFGPPTVEAMPADNLMVRFCKAPA